MSIYGKFLPEFTPGDWSFVWEMDVINAITSSTVSTASLSCSFTSGDASGTLLSFLSTFNARVYTAVRGLVQSIGLGYAGYNTSNVHPGSVSFYRTYYQSTALMSSTETIEYSTFAVGMYGRSVTVGGTTYNAEFSRVDFTSSDDGILALFGFDESETVGSNYLVASNGYPRQYWLPGVGTYTGTGGAGITSDTGWVPVDAHSRVVSGAGNMRITGPSRLQYTRRIRFEAMKRSEVLDSRHSGPIAFFDQWATKTFRWYPDRDVGTVTTAGTQGDPGPPSYHTDDDCDYWLCKLASEPRITQGSDPDWFTVTLDLNGEPV